jgi:hypothetical protein
MKKKSLELHPERSGVMVDGGGVLQRRGQRVVCSEEEDGNGVLRG